MYGYMRAVCEPDGDSGGASEARLHNRVDEADERAARVLGEKLPLLLLLVAAGAGVRVLLAHEHLAQAPSEHYVRRVGLIALPAQMRVRRMDVTLVTRA